MRIEEFDYHLPLSLIAQYPPARRGDSSLMILHRPNGSIEHRAFRDLYNLLNRGDLLVINNTRVLPARLIGKKESGGKVEILLVSPLNGAMGEWSVLIKRSAKLNPHVRIEFSRELLGELDESKNGRGKIRFFGQGEVMGLIRKVGHVPLPPYIKRHDEPLDRDRYQTVFAVQDGSIAAPTAGLHFTQDLLESLKDRGVGIVPITLHVGLGTFIPVKSKNVEDHAMEPEWVEISEETSQEINRTRARGGKIIAVGTTTTRALETFPDGNGGVKPAKGMTSLFIYPPYRFRVIDGLITNFHLPKSTLIMLVSAFGGKDLIAKAYQEAINNDYRFYSYGDSMLIL